MSHRLLRSLATLGVLVTLMVVGSPAIAAETDPSAEQQLAERYAPQVRLVAQAADCGPGEAYQPSNVDPLFGNDSVALRGPWTSTDLIKVAPTADDISTGLAGYSLDFPGDPLSPGCDYEKWADTTFATSSPTVYAHVATEEGYPGKLALQYWFYYPFNDYNNKHESDWERIQVEFDANDAAEALQSAPTRVVYSEHEGAEQAGWDDDKLARVDDTHPVVYVSAGSHANHYESALYLGRSASQGLGCDSTLAPSTTLDPVVQSIPTDPVAALRQYPWLGYQGTWGQREPRNFYTGPTGPSTKAPWEAPFTWSATAADRSYQVPGGSVYGVKSTDFFCSVVGKASVAALRFTSDPLPTLVVLALVLGLVVWLVRRTSWGSSRVLPLNQRRTVGETIAVAWRAYRARPLMFLGIGAVVAVGSVVTSLARQLVSGAPVTSTDQPATQGGAAITVGLISVLILLFLLVLSQAATVAAMVDLDAGRPTGIIPAYREALSNSLRLIVTSLVWMAIIVVLAVSVFLIPLALVVAIGAALYVPVAQIEGRMGPAALWRSWRLVRRQFFRVVVLEAFALGLSALVSGLIGSLVLLLVQAPFIVVNLLPGVISALIGPFVALIVTYMYFNGRALEDDPPPRIDPLGVPLGSRAPSS